MWHLRQSGMLLRLRALMICIQSGFSLCPCLFRSANLRMWCISTFSLEPHTSHSPFNSRSTISDLVLKYGWGVRSFPAVFLRLSESPPKIATSGFFPSRSTVTFKLTRGPFGVCVFDFRRLSVFTNEVLFFPAIVFNSDVSIVYRR